jgi:signal transduction histidine kinase
MDKAGSLKTILPLVLLILLSYSSIGQNFHKIDSLKGEMKVSKGEKQFDFLNAIGFEFRYSFPDSTIRYCTMAYALGQKLSLKKSLSRPLSFIGLAKANQGDYKGALDYHNRSIETAFLQNDTIQLAHGYNNAGRVYLDEGDLPRAYNNFIRSKDLFEDIHDKSGLAYVYRSMADLYKSKKDYVKAIENSKTALELRKELKDPRAVVSASMELGLVYQAVDSTPMALKQLSFADSLASSMKDKITLAELRIARAEILFDEGRKNEASDIIKDVLPLVSENNNQKIYLRVRLLMAKVSLEMKKMEQAIAILSNVFERAEKTGNLMFQRDAARLLSEGYASQNKSALALQYSDLHQLLNEKIQNADLNKEIEKLQFQLQIEKTERENESLRVQQANDESLIAYQRFQNIALIIVIVFVAGIALLLRSIGLKRRKINQKLEEQNLHILSQQQEITKKNEALIRRNNELDEINHEKDTLMNIVAHDLKSPFNRIIGLSNILEFEGNLNPTQKEYVRLLKESTRSGLDLITDLLDVHEIHHDPVLMPFNFDQWFNDRVDAFRPVAEVKGSTIKANCGIDKKLISEPAYLGRILDNLISNAIKFSPRNSDLEVQAGWNNGVLDLRVKDKAPGFTEEDQKFMYQKFKKLSARPTAGESSNGLGLAIVKALVDRMRGSIELKSSRKGSEFLIKIPTKIFEEAALH